jgi:3-hydroxybutyryl-CoA dehydrogenase
MKTINTIGVLGAGVMGNGIVQVAAQAGYNVVMKDIEERFLETGYKNINRFLSKTVERGKITEDSRRGIMERIQCTTKMEDLQDVDFVVEVVVEDMEVKRKVFSELDELTQEDVVLSSNTSSMSITALGACTRRPDKVVGMHFFNPVPLMRLVEVIRGVNTSDETVSATMDLSRKMGKEAVEVKFDFPGFLSTRLMMAHVMEAIKMYELGIASKEDIDKTAKLALNYPMGPFELMDFTGLDIHLHVQEYLKKALPGELKWEPSVTLRNMVNAGNLGRKSGRGWFDYTSKPAV